jgi:predicted ATP-grasp superfamily ATP-dependent carboligase
MPETGGLLERISRLTLEAGCRLIGSRPDAVRLAASKRQTSAWLRRHGIAVVPSYAVAEPVEESAARWVSKPDDGVGCEGIRIFESREALAAALGSEASEDYVVQPYTEGIPASLSLLCQAGEACLLSCNRQQVAEVDGRFHLRGIDVNGLGDSDTLAELGRAIARAIPDLWGYVGVDMICTASGPRVLEINPRLTVSYAGLRAALKRNPAELVLRLLREGPAVLAERRRVRWPGESDGCLRGASGLSHRLALNGAGTPRQ